jgi:hypothetical protein
MTEDPAKLSPADPDELRLALSAMAAAGSGTAMI